MDRSRSAFATEDLRITYLHSAIFLGSNNEVLSTLTPEGLEHPPGAFLIWHATAVSGRTCVWTIERFEQYYRLISARRFT